MNKFTDYLKKYGVRIAIEVVIVALFSGIISSKTSTGASALEDATESLAMPASKGASGIVGWLESIYGYMFRYDSLAQENEELKTKVTELENELREANEAAAENVQLREVLGLRQKYSNFVLESAHVVDRGTSNWNTTLTISKGEEDGIEIGDCVVDSAYNLVGQVIEVGSGWATIRSVIDTDMRIGVLVGESKTAAMVVGDFALMRSGYTKLTYLTSGSQVFENDVLLTSGKGKTYPKNLVVGTVESVYTEAGGQVEYATIIPEVDPNLLTQVFIIKEFEVIE